MEQEKENRNALSLPTIAAWLKPRLSDLCSFLLIVIGVGLFAYHYTSREPGSPYWPADRRGMAIASAMAAAGIFLATAKSRK